MGNTQSEVEKLENNQDKDTYQIQLYKPDINKYINSYFDVSKFNYTLSTYWIRSGYFELLHFLEKYGNALYILCVSNVSANTWLYNRKNYKSIDEYLETLKPNNPRLEVVAH